MEKKLSRIKGMELEKGEFTNEEFFEVVRVVDGGDEEKVKDQ